MRYICPSSHKLSCKFRDCNYFVTRRASFYRPARSESNPSRVPDWLWKTFRAAHLRLCMCCGAQHTAHFCRIALWRHIVAFLSLTAKTVYEILFESFFDLTTGFIDVIT